MHKTGKMNKSRRRKGRSWGKMEQRKRNIIVDQIAEKYFEIYSRARLQYVYKYAKIFLIFIMLINLLCKKEETWQTK